ncbi:methyl-accepting chemotaxis protein [Aquisalimonas asiatica]|uniref:Methyl-accepting chemotaxis protein n=1 Tax=Aquisalimonas asiatica TaxID=406100 RepID=A0A1H8VXD3_9GAMM|nr:methyl-accepting chemotaxis protein [Aquisalimonas asiatica]SEP20059.1 methyl-accepting chemotaxis protein [Aquisalimonas asiatica]
MGATSALAIREARISGVEAFSQASTREIRQIDFATTEFIQHARQSLEYLARLPVLGDADGQLSSYVDTREVTPLEGAEAGGVEGEIFEHYRRLGEANPAFEYVYMGTPDGGYAQWPEGEISAGFDPRERPWYQAATDDPGQVVLTDAYYFDVDDVALVGLARTIEGGDGDIVGVQSVDISLEQLRERVSEIEFGDSGYLMVIEDSGTVLVDPQNPEHAFEDIRSLDGEGYSTLAAAADGSLTVSLDGEAYQANVYTSPELGWRFIGVIPRNEMLAAANRMTTQMVVAGLVVIALVIGVALVFARYLTRPIRTLTDRMRDIAAGEGDLTQRLPVQGRDEMAELATGFNGFVDKVQSAISDVDGTTHELASAATELEQVATSTRDIVRKQGDETDQIASAINEMTATIQEISANGSTVQQAAGQADSSARAGHEHVSENFESMQTLAEDIDATSQAVTALAERSREIETVLDVIHEVTEQTNLLALNAAIEAARAGEHGRGFAVVADEVRGLAKRSNESAGQIREIIGNLRSETDTAVETMQNSRARSERNLERARTAGESIETIKHEVGRIHEQITQIATSAEEQSQVAEEINRNITAIVEAARNSSSGMEQTRQSSEEVARTGERLRQVVGRFRI